MTKYVKLKDIISLYIDETRQTIGDFARLWTIGFRGIVELGFDVNWNAKTVRIKVNDNKTADLPKDFLAWVKIGVLNGYGEISTLSVNRNLSKFKDNNPNRLADNPSDVNSVVDYLTSPFYFNIFDNGCYSHAFGVQSGLLTAGECNVDEENGVIILNPTFQYANIMLEYISSPEQDDDYTIDLQCQEAMIAWLYYRDNRGRIRNIGEGQVQQLKRDWHDAKKLAKKRLKPFRLQEAEQVLREGAKLVVKV